MDRITKALYETWKQIVTEGKWEPYIDPKTGKTEHRFVGGNDVIDPNKYINPKPSPGPRPWRPGPRPDIDPGIDLDRNPIIPYLTPKPKPRPGTGDGGWGGAQPAQPRYDEDDNYISNTPAAPIKRQEDPREYKISKKRDLRKFPFLYQNDIGIKPIIPKG